MDRKSLVAHLNAKIAPIQPLRWNAMLGATPLPHDRVGVPENSMRWCAPDHTGTLAGARMPHAPADCDRNRRAPNRLGISGTATDRSGKRLGQYQPLKKRGSCRREAASAACPCSAAADWARTTVRYGGKGLRANQTIIVGVGTDPEPRHTQGNCT